MIRAARPNPLDPGQQCDYHATICVGPIMLDTSSTCRVPSFFDLSLRLFERSGSRTRCDTIDPKTERLICR